MRKSQSVFFVLYIVLLILLNSCATMDKAKEMPPKQQAVMWAALYNQEYKNTNAAIMNAMIVNAPPEEKEFLLKKMKILKELKPLIAEYETIVWADGTPSAKLEYTILYLIDQLTAEIIRRKS